MMKKQISAEAVKDFDHGPLVTITLGPVEHRLSKSKAMTLRNKINSAIEDVIDMEIANTRPGERS